MIHDMLRRMWKSKVKWILRLSCLVWLFLCWCEAPSKEKPYYVFSHFRVTFLCRKRSRAVTNKRKNTPLPYV